MKESFATVAKSIRQGHCNDTISNFNCIPRVIKPFIRMLLHINIDVSQTVRMLSL